MHDRERIRKSDDEEVALVVRVILPDDPVELDPLEELTGLAETCLLYTSPSPRDRG